MTVTDPCDPEARRLALQATLDAGKTKPARNRLGQFATPTILARELLAHAVGLLPQGEPIRFLDPAIGTGSFYSALTCVAAPGRIERAQGCEIDPHYGEPARRLWAGTPLKIDLRDFTTATPPAPRERANLLVCNPPYVRHHHLAAEDKQRLCAASRAAAGIELSGLAGLYCHFLALSHGWMSEGGVACWLVPSEFMDVNYGRELKRYLLERVTLLRVHRFDPNDVQFDDALVSSAVVWLRNSAPPPDHEVNFTYGGSHAAPRLARAVPAALLHGRAKWTRFPAEDVKPHEEIERISDLFEIRRGIATGGNDFFILTPERIAELGLPMSQFRPILPSPRHLPQDRIEADAAGHPLVERRLFLLDCRLPEDQIRARHPALWAYLASGRETVGQGYLCRQRGNMWWVQESRAPAPFVCTYMGRSDGPKAKPFRFLLNRSKAIVANTWLNLYPRPHVARRLAERPELLEQVWQALDAIGPRDLMAEGRVYGGGLHKMEPKELAQVPAGAIAALLELGPTGELFA